MDKAKKELEFIKYTYVISVSHGRAEVNGKVCIFITTKKIIVSFVV